MGKPYPIDMYFKGGKKLFKIQKLLSNHLSQMLKFRFWTPRKAQRFEHKEMDIASL